MAERAKSVNYSERAKSFINSCKDGDDDVFLCLQVFFKDELSGMQVVELDNSGRSCYRYLYMQGGVFGDALIINVSMSSVFLSGMMYRLPLHTDFLLHLDQLHDVITELIEARKRAGVHCQIPVKIYHHDGYLD
ncbi:hypothetical protein Tco_1250792 [Tanacetum coccineum]